MILSNKFQKICVILFSLTTLVWVITAGAAHLIPSYALVFLAFVWLGFAVWGNRSSLTDSDVLSPNNIGAMTAFNAFWICMIVVCAFSLLPFPYAFVKAISPNAAQYYYENALLLGDLPSTASFSVSRADTAYALWVLLGQFALFNAAARTFYRRENIKFSLGVLFAAGGLLVIMELANTVLSGALSSGATGASALWHIGVPINPNHAAGTLAAISVLALASDLLKRHGDPALNKKIGRLAVWFITSACVFMLQSRGAMLAWGIAHLLLIAVLFMRAVRSRARSIILSIILLISLGAGLVLISHASIERSVQEIQNTNIAFSADDYGFAAPTPDKPLEKTILYADFLKLAQDWFPVGYGRNAFDDVFPKYQSFAFSKRFNHAENEPFEIIMEYGVLVSAVLFVFLMIGTTVVVRTNNRFHSDRTMNALMLALLVLIIQNFFDFGLRYWTTGFPAVLFAGIICGRVDYLNSKSPSQSDPPKSRPRLVCSLKIVSCLFTISSIMIAISSLGDATDGLTNTQFKRFRESFSQGLEIGSDAGEVLFRDKSAVRRYLSAHAASAAFPALVSHALLTANNNSLNKKNIYTTSLLWIQTAVKREPKTSQYLLRLAKNALALQDNDLAARSLSDAIENNTQHTLIAASELHQFPEAVFQRISIRKPFASRLLQMSTILLKSRKFVESLEMANHADALDEPHIGRHIRYNTWLEMGFMEGAKDIAESISVVDNINDFVVLTSWLVNIKDTEKLLSLLHSTEISLSDESDYWRLRAIYIAYYAPIDDNTKNEFSRVLFRLNKIALTTKSCRFDALLAEAEFALRAGELSHASNAAERALKIRPNSKQAQLILKASQKNNDL